MAGKKKSFDGGDGERSGDEKEAETKAKAKKESKQSKRSKRAKKPRQQVFEFKQWGGARKGAGRKRKAERPQVPHRARESFSKTSPVLVTQRILKGLPSLRKKAVRRELEECLAAAQKRHGMRIVHYSFQPNHLHLLVEAESDAALAQAMGALSTRFARALNRVWQRVGSVFPDRYHSRVLHSPREVRNAIAYVLRNCAHHGIYIVGIDPFSSGGCFDGWEEAVGPPDEARHVARPETWLLREGWKRRGLVSAVEVPGRAA